MAEGSIVVVNTPWGELEQSIAEACVEACAQKWGRDVTNKLVDEFASTGRVLFDVSSIRPEELQISSNLDSEAFKASAGDFNVNDPIITRHFVTSWTGSMDSMNSNPQFGQWRVVEPTMFQSRTRFGPNPENKILDVPSGNVHEAILHKLTLEQYHSTAPIPLTVTFDQDSMHAARGNVRLANNDRVGAVLMPGTSDRPIVIAAENKYAGSDYLTMFPGYTPGKLRGRGTVEMKGSDSMYVQIDHPIVEELYAQDPQFKAYYDDQQARDLLRALEGRYWIRMPREKFEEGHTSVERTLKTHLPLVDLSKMTITLSRPGQRWDAPIPELMSPSEVSVGAGLGDAASEESFDPYSAQFGVTAVFCIKYSLPSSC